MDESNKNISVVFAFGALITTYFLAVGSKPIIPYPVVDSLQPVKIDTLMPKQHTTSSTVDPFSSNADTCYVSPNQTVVEWKYLYWFSCKLSWKGICFWPPQRKHMTYKITLNEGIPVRGKNGRPIPIAKGKVRDWFVYDAKAWNALENKSRGKRYVDYERIAPNEYVVEIETRYRLLNNVEATLSLCTEQP